MIVNYNTPRTLRPKKTKVFLLGIKFEFYDSHRDFFFRKLEVIANNYAIYFQYKFELAKVITKIEWYQFGATIFCFRLGQNSNEIIAKLQRFLSEDILSQTQVFWLFMVLKISHKAKDIHLQERGRIYREVLQNIRKKIIFVRKLNLGFAHMSITLKRKE